MSVNFSDYKGLLQFAVLLLATAAAILLMIYGRGVLVPIILALIIWWLINDVTDMVHQRTVVGWQMPRPVAMLLVFIMFMGFLVWVSSVFYWEYIAFTNEIPDHRNNILTLLQRVPPWMWRALSISDSGDVNSVVEALTAFATNSIATYSASIAASLAGIIGQAALVLLYVVFLLLEQNTFPIKLREMFPTQMRLAEVQEVLRSMQENIHAYVTVKTYISLATAVIAYIVMWLFGLQHAIVWAILTFALNYIPNVGSIIATIFPTITALVQGEEPISVISLFLLLATIQMIIGSFVEPKLMGNRLNISAFVVLVCLTVFGTIWGIIGAFLSVPLTMILIIIMGHFPSTRPIAILLSGDGFVCEVEEEEEPEPIVASSQASA